MQHVKLYMGVHVQYLHVACVENNHLLYCHCMQRNAKLYNPQPPFYTTLYIIFKMAAAFRSLCVASVLVSFSVQARLGSSFHLGPSTLTSSPAVRHDSHAVASMSSFVNHFFNDKTAYMMSKDCSSSALDTYFSEEGWMFTPARELIKATASQVHEVFHHHCVEQQKTLGGVQAMTVSLHGVKGDFDGDANTGVLYGTLSEKTKGSEANKEADLRFTFTLEKHKPVRNAGWVEWIKSSILRKVGAASWKISRMHFSKV